MIVEFIIEINTQPELVGVSESDVIEQPTSSLHIVDGTTIRVDWSVVPTQAMLDQLDAEIALNDYSTWFASHGGNPIATAKRLAKELYEKQDEQGRQIRAALQVVVDEFNRHSNRAFAGITINSQQAPQAIDPSTPTKVLSWQSNAASFLATPDFENNQIILGDAGSYIVSLNASYAVSLGADCDMTWSVYANGVEVAALKARQQVDTGIPSVITIGPIALNAPSDNIVIDVRVQHNESGARNLILGYAQFHAERIPTIPARTFDDLKAAVANAIDAE